MFFSSKFPAIPSVRAKPLFFQNAVNLCFWKLQLTPVLFLLYLGDTSCRHSFWKKQFWGFHVITSREREIYMDMIRELVKESDFWLCHETLKFKKRFPLGGGKDGLRVHKN